MPIVRSIQRWSAGVCLRRSLRLRQRQLDRDLQPYWDRLPANGTYHRGISPQEWDARMSAAEVRTTRLYVVAMCLASLACGLIWLLVVKG